MHRKALRWRSRRGMKELDVLLERYFERRYDAASADERAEFERLLAHEDPDIWLWLMGQASAPPEFTHVLDALRSA